MARFEVSPVLGWGRRQAPWFRLIAPKQEGQACAPYTLHLRIRLCVYSFLSLSLTAQSWPADDGWQESALKNKTYQFRFGPTS